MKKIINWEKEFIKSQKFTLYVSKKLTSLIAVNGWLAFALLIAIMYIFVTK